MANSWIVLRTHDGEYLAQFDKAIRWELARSTNSAGAWAIILSGDTDKRLFDMDRIVEFWREPVGGHETLLGVGFMRRWHFFESPDGAEFVRCTGHDQIGLLGRRIVANYKGTDYTKKSDYADDMIKEIITEQFVNTSARFGDIYYSRSSALSTAHFSVAPDESQGREIDKEFAWRNVLTTIQEIAEASQWPTRSMDGVPVYFDLEYTGPAKFVFKTYANSRGVDRTVSGGIAPVIFSVDRANLGRPSLDWRYDEEINMVYGGGPGQETSRMIDPENDQVRHNYSIWNYQESFKDAREATERPEVSFIAYTEMQNRLPYVEFSGDLLDTPRSRFGVDWMYGDEVTCRYKGFSFDGIVDGFLISVDQNGVEDIRASVKIIEAIEGNPT
jgi:hypothetical protein